MSYDYNALVSKIQNHRENHEWIESVETFGTLSTLCPMTPLLWIQYAHDTSKLLGTEEGNNQDSLKVMLETLELGLTEFPGCALLHLYYVENLIQSIEFNTSEKIEHGIQNSLQTVGRGSHCNEDFLIVQIYRHLIAFKVRNGKLSKDEVIRIFFQRATTPMKKGNEVLRYEFEKFVEENDIKVSSDDFEYLEKGRRQAGVCYGTLRNFEDNVDEAMEMEQILYRHSFDQNDPIDWNVLISANTNFNYWMGLGSSQTAQSFIKYAKECSSFPKEAKSMEEGYFDNALSLTISIYERGVSECPTVECIWNSYLQDLLWMVQNGHIYLASTLKTVASRSVLNCPYSLSLAKIHLETCLILANLGNTVLDLDLLTSMIKNIMNAKFLSNPSHHLELFLTAIRIVKKRILYLLVQKYDEAYDKKDDRKIKHLSDAAEEEIQDLVEDLREMYDEAYQFLEKNHINWSEGRFYLLNERCKTEKYMLTPLLQAMNDSPQHAPSEPQRCFGQLVELHPSHPDSYRGFIEALISFPSTSAQEVAINLQKVRLQYHNALKAISSKSDPLLETAKQNLCQEFFEFEKLFGSDKSSKIALKLVRSKLKNRGERKNEKHSCSENNNEGNSTKKRKQDEASEINPKKQRVLSSINQKKIDETVPINNTTKDITSSNNKIGSIGENILKKKSDSTVDKKITKTESIVSKVTVGSKEYPAHPFTIRVLNLSPEVEDMDLIDLFRPKCGAVVHAKIIREKQNRHGRKGRSKGWGLVQFEERDSVSKALALHDVIGLHNKILQIEKSHMAAASLVPPGMHRVKPKGEGKVSKRNQKNKEKNSKDLGEAEVKLLSSDGKRSSTSVAILSFQPRELLRKNNRKPKVNLK